MLATLLLICFFIMFFFLILQLLQPWNAPLLFSMVFEKVTQVQILPWEVQGT